MKIAITLDDVIRNKSKQIIKMYKKYLNPDFDEEAADISSNDFKEILGFETKSDYNKFLYEDYAFEIFAEGETVEKMVDKKLNLWLLAVNADTDEDDEQIEVMLANPYEFNSSIGFTHFFLSKIATRVRETYFPLSSLDIWNRCDVLITADPNLIKNKPEGKKVIKITTDYNKELDADYTYESLSKFLEDEEIIDKLKENKND